MSPAVIEQRKKANLRHGSHSTYQISAGARAQKRRFLRQIGMKVGDLDGIALGLLDNWARAHAKVVMLDRWFDERGLIDENGEVRSASRLYFTALNQARLALARLGEHLRSQGVKGETLTDYLVQTYGNGDEGPRSA